MNFVKNIKVRAKLLIGFLIVAVFVAIVGVVGMVSLKNVHRESHMMYSQNLRSVYILTDMKQNLTEIKSSILSLVYANDTTKRQSWKK